jgi:hypothetical protein
LRWYHCETMALMSLPDWSIWSSSAVLWGLIQHLPLHWM